MEAIKEDSLLGMAVSFDPLHYYPPVGVDAVVGMGLVFKPAYIARSHKSRAAVDYTLIGVEPHRPTRGVWPIAAVTNDSQLHLVASSILGHAQHSSDSLNVGLRVNYLDLNVET